ncbi:hypothetical protein [Geomicrobium sp. JCM 19039]|uniref:hypothetical protein n=1 Tax=Geomicrobium sp. JCM 19039 TaxID=1460636 RepID=UPI001267FE5E|nr:hypothetical protein [Geomicrobium sp. JCM 19039]
MNMVLLVTLHDPKSALLTKMHEHGEQLNAYFTEKIATCSEETPNVLQEELQRLGFLVQIIPAKGAAHARHSLLQLANERTQSDHFHYCDTDRLLTWLDTAKEQLAAVHKTIQANDYTVIGRSEQAFRSHPESWQQTESIVNRLFSKEMGEEDWDVTAGSCGMNRASLRTLMHEKVFSMNDAAWPLQVKKRGGAVGYVESDGLAYTQLNRGTEDEDGLLAWRGRLRLALDITDSIRDVQGAESHPGSSSHFRP